MNPEDMKAFSDSLLEKGSVFEPPYPIPLHPSHAANIPVPQNHIHPPINENELNSNFGSLCNLLVEFLKQQKTTNELLRQFISANGRGSQRTSQFKIKKLANQGKYDRFLVVIENNRSHPKMDCPICQETVEITTDKRGGCKQQSICGDFVVCNECTNDALQKILRCPVCCEQYSNIPVSLCSHMSQVSSVEGHLARKGSGSGCPLCSGKMVKEKCPYNCSRKTLEDYNMAKISLSDRVFVLVKNPEACAEEDDRPCSHYCRCAIHNTLFTNRNKGAKCKECTLENTKSKKALGKRKRFTPKSEPPLQNIPPHPMASELGTFTTPPVNYGEQHMMNPNLNHSTVVHQMARAHQGQNMTTPHPNQSPNGHIPEFAFGQDISGVPGVPGVPGAPGPWLPVNFPGRVRELGKRMYPELGVMEFGKRVTNNLSYAVGSTLGSFGLGYPEQEEHEEHEEPPF